jgi:hypothetical protein
MQFEVYQIIVPIIAIVIIATIYIRFIQGKTSWQELLAGSVFWLAVAIFSIFPDFFSNMIARFFGIKSNINAIIFFCLGLIFFFQYKLFFMFKKQEEAITKLARDKAIEDAFKNDLS